jgi:hypothetical protein
MDEVPKQLGQRNVPVLMRVVLFWCCYMAVLFFASTVKAKVPPQWGQLVLGACEQCRSASAHLGILAARRPHFSRHWHEH